MLLISTSPHVPRVRRKCFTEQTPLALYSWLLGRYEKNKKLALGLIRVFHLLETGSAHGAAKKRETSIFISVDIFLCQEPFSSSPGSSFFHTLKIICQSLSSNFGQEQKSSGGILSLTSETLQAKFNGAISARTKTFGPF